MANMLIAGFAFGMAIHHFIEDEWIFGILNLITGSGNVVIGLML